MHALARWSHGLLPALALGMAAYLILPATEARAFSKLGFSLGLDQRDVRVFNNFQDESANDNTTPHPNWPGWDGADLAIWKAVAEWGSTAHGDGTGDTAGNPVVGSGGANFDAAWMGSADGVGGLNDNIVSATICGGGLIAFTETPDSDGWRMRFCEELVWSDGPGAPGFGEADIQTVMTHEYGHALGLGNSNVPDATMFSGPPTQPLGPRSIEADDMAGLQCIYGVANATKPTITSAQVAGSTIVLTGSNFDPSSNDLWFTSAVATPQGGDPRARVLGVPSIAGGTRITATLPVDAGPGDVLVRIPGTDTGGNLSNAFPYDPGDTDGDFPNVNCPAELAGDPVLTDTGGDPSIGPRIADLTEVFDLSLDCSAASVPGVYAMTLKLVKLGSPATVGVGFLWGSGPKLFKCGGLHNADVVDCIGAGGLSVPNDPSLFGISYVAQGFCVGSPTRTSNAIQQTLGL